jgi:hypothetical protein
MSKQNPAKHEHENGAELTDDCDNWCRCVLFPMNIMKRGGM